MTRVTVTCPYCGSTASYNVSVRTGLSGAWCRFGCRRGFWIRMWNGGVESVRR
jgi:hypothetical protein